MTSLWVGLGSLALVSFAVSALVSATWLVVSHGSRRLTPAAESRLLMLLVVLPLAVAGISVLAYMEWPGNIHGDHAWVETAPEPVGTEGREHDDAEHSRPQDTPVFAQTVFVAFVLLGTFLVARLILMLFRVGRAIRTSVATASHLSEVATPGPSDTLVLPSDRPEAFVLGVVKPKLFVSRGLLSMPAETVNAVLAHERAHIRRLDPLRHLLVLVACIFHLPGVAKRLQQRTQQTQELSADAHAAAVLGDPTSVAEALVRCTRFHSRHSAPHLAFGGGDIEERVRTLLAGQRTMDHPRPWLVALLGVASVFLAVRYAGPAHHVVEILTAFG